MLLPSAPMRYVVLLWCAFRAFCLLCFRCAQCASHRAHSFAFEWRTGLCVSHVLSVCSLLLPSAPMRVCCSPPLRRVHLRGRLACVLRPAPAACPPPLPSRLAQFSLLLLLLHSPHGSTRSVCRHNIHVCQRCCSSVFHLLRCKRAPALQAPSPSLPSAPSRPLPGACALLLRRAEPLSPMLLACAERTYMCIPLYICILSFLCPVSGSAVGAVVASFRTPLYRWVGSSRNARGVLPRWCLRVCVLSYCVPPKLKPPVALLVCVHVSVLRFFALSPRRACS
jgi:hypothetical protein